MISFLKKIKINKIKSQKLNKGMTYVELIVVLSIFSVMSSIVLFDYKKFQDKVDIKILANDIALRIVEAQKSSVAGKWNFNASASWKPSYGIFFDLSENKNFIFFADLNNNASYEDLGCTGECLENIEITKNNYISQIESYSGITPTLITNPLSITFKRPDSVPIFKSNGLLLTGFDYLKITTTSDTEITASIKVYPSGRIQLD